MKLFPMLLPFLAGAHAAMLTKRAGGFVGQCKDFKLEEPENSSRVLKAKCGSDSTELALDGCVANREGNLVWQKE